MPDSTMHFQCKIFKKPAIKWVVAGLVVTYLIAPFISGLLDYSDRRGPLIYPVEYHEILHTLGRALVGRGATKIPFTERPWFYGLPGKPIDKNSLQRKLENLVTHEEKPETNGAGRDVLPTGGR